MMERWIEKILERERYRVLIIFSSANSHENHVGLDLGAIERLDSLTKIRYSNLWCKRLEQPNWMQQLANIIGDWDCSFNRVD